MAKKKSRAKTKRWYPVSTLGIICTALYALVPPYIVYAQSTDTFPEVLRIPLLSGFLLVLGCMLISWHADIQPFHKKHGSGRSH